MELYKSTRCDECGEVAPVAVKVAGRQFLHAGAFAVICKRCIDKASRLIDAEQTITDTPEETAQKMR